MKRTAEVTLRIVWDDTVEDHPATWTWTCGLDARPGIDVVHHAGHDVHQLLSRIDTFWCRTCKTHFTREDA